MNVAHGSAGVPGQVYGPTGTTVYLDYASTAPTLPIAVEAMLPLWGQTWGNPSSLYAAGRQARAALDRARAAVAGVLGCHPREITFTSGGTESDNLALRGVVERAREGGNRPHLVTSAAEHSAVLDTAAALARTGVDVTYLPVDEYGAVSPAALADALRPETCLVSLMVGNNEVGTINPIAALAAVARERGVPFHTDAAQAPGVLPVDVDALGVDLLSLSAHKFGGPKGAGVLYTRRGTRLAPQITGGGQEMHRRAGTENVAFAVGLATALTYAETHRVETAAHVARLRDSFVRHVLVATPDARLFGHPTDHLPGIANLGFAGVEAESLLILLDAEGIAAAAGAVCASGSIEPSHVLLAMGVPADYALGSVRFSFGTANTDADLATACEAVPRLVARLRGLSPRVV